MSNHRPVLEPRVFPSSGWQNVEESIKIEEETLPRYEPERFYPVRLGEVFNHRYQVVGKIGFGSTATIWLCRDLEDGQYMTLKIYTDFAKSNREVEVYKHLQTIKSSHPGQEFLRTATDIFQAQNPNGKRMHNCLVHPPLGIDLSQFTPLLPGKVMDASQLRYLLRNILLTLDFLHSEANVIHTDVQSGNILLGIEDISILSKFEQEELDDPIPRKVLEDRTIYFSRPFPVTDGMPILCDLGEARIGTEKQQGDIMPELYRAPEVLLGRYWDSKVDVWSVGMLIWSLFEGDHLFKAPGSARRLDDENHFAQMQAVLGPPPLEFVMRSKKTELFWDNDGNWIGSVPIPDRTLETLEQRLGGDEKSEFLCFLRRALCWLPEDRPTAKELLYDPWLMADIIKRMQENAD